MSFSEEGSEATPVNGDAKTTAIASELGPGRIPMEGARDVNQESLYEVSVTAYWPNLLQLIRRTLKVWFPSWRVATSSAISRIWRQVHRLCQRPSTGEEYRGRKGFCERGS